MFIAAVQSVRQEMILPLASLTCRDGSKHECSAAMSTGHDACVHDLALGTIATGTFCASTALTS